MWRLEDSDHSISDEDYDYDWAENRVSLADVTSKKECGVGGIASKLELLTGTSDTNLEEKATHHEIVGFFSEDEVEFPDFNKEGQLKDLKDAESNFLESACVASCHELQMRKDGSSLVYVSGAYTSPKTYRQSIRCDQNFGRLLQPVSSGDNDGFLKVAKNTSSPLYHSIQFKRSANEDEDLYVSKNSLLLQRTAKAEHVSTKASSSNALGCFHGEMFGVSEFALQAEGDSPHDCSKLSIAELLDNLQEKNGGSKVNSKIRRPTRRRKCPLNQSNSNLRKKVPEDEDPCELPMDDELSDHDKGFVKRPALRINEADRDTEPKSKTMADQFQEVIGFSDTSDDAGLVSGLNKARGCSGILLGRLQKVIQWEKDQDLAFLKSVQPEPSQKLRCIDVKILSRSFTGKLTACLCFVYEARKGSTWTEIALQEKLTKERTIIFNSRVCGDVELEVGTSVRIYHPWKEVHTSEAAEVILALYFSRF